MSKTHAEILADIAKQVVAEHRKVHVGDWIAEERYDDMAYTLYPTGATTDPDRGNVPVPEYPPMYNKTWTQEDASAEQARWLEQELDPSWNYTLPERYQG
jgi:hypothetical protein